MTLSRQPWLSPIVWVWAALAFPAALEAKEQPKADASAKRDDVAFAVDGQNITIQQLYKDNQSAFFEVEKQKYELIERFAQEKYMQSFWDKKAKKDGVSPDKAREDYMAKNVKISSKEIDSTLEKFKDHPQLKKLSDADQKEQVKNFLRDRQERELMNGVITTATTKGELAVLYPKPKEPLYDLPVTNADPVRYGPEPTDVSPVGCKGDDCAVTIIEYSDFECPFCARVMPDVKKVLTDYKGKIRWITRDFPLSFHERARPAGLAAKCVGKDKYWGMYTKLFENQTALGDEDLKNYAKAIGADMAKYEACMKTPGDAAKDMELNLRTGMSAGVSGTPAFFINGRKLSGALPYADFKKVIDEELASGPKKR